MRIQSFGTLPDGRRVDAFTLGDGDVRATVLSYGGILRELLTPDRAGRRCDICAGFDSLAGYVEQRTFFGALIGRVANRIRGGRFFLDGKECRLSRNDNGLHHLHGGVEGFDRKLWKAEPDGERLRLDLFSPDGEEGYPGNLRATAWYGVRGGELSIEYRADCDAPTPVNLTNHAFFNLNGFESDVLNHTLMIGASRYAPVDDALVPTGEIADVAGTPFDFTAPRRIGDDIAKLPAGYDHAYFFDAAANRLARALDPESGRTLEMRTTEPCVQLYSGNFLDGSVRGKNGVAYKKHCAFCLEAEKAPDAVNHPAFPGVILRPGETYRQETVYAFSTDAAT